MPRARGGRGMGKGTGRGRAVTGPAAVTPVADGRSERQAAFEARKVGLLEKTLDLAEMEEAAVAVVCSGIDGLGDADCWPSVEAARAVAELFHELPKEIRNADLRAHASYASHVRRKLFEVREGGIVDALGPWERALDGMTVKALLEVLASIEVSQKATRSRIRELQPQPEESVAENSVAGQEAATPASGEVQGKLKHLPGVDEEDAPWMKQLVEDLNENAEPANGNAAPCDTGMIEHINAAGVEDASVEVQGRQKQPQDADEVQGTQKQPPGDDDEDTAWMKQLVEDLKEKPEPASGSAAPYDPGMIEYINVGGYVMEQDAYDFIRFDLGMFPPSLQPESPDYDEPLRLWSWDDSSFPQGAPPPRSSKLRTC